MDFDCVREVAKPCYTVAAVAIDGKIFWLASRNKCRLLPWLSKKLSVLLQSVKVYSLLVKEGLA